jgi:hypothetical protein
MIWHHTLDNISESLVPKPIPSTESDIYTAYIRNKLKATTPTTIQPILEIEADDACDRGARCRI